MTSLSFYSSFWRRKWQPTPVFLPGESHEQRSLVGLQSMGCKELDKAKQLTHTHTHTHTHTRALKWPSNDHLAVNYPQTPYLPPSRSHFLVSERHPPLLSQIRIFVSTDLQLTFSSRNPKQKHLGKTGEAGWVFL